MRKPKLYSWVTEERDKLSVHVAKRWHGVKVTAEIMDDFVEFRVYETFGCLDEDSEGANIKQIKSIKAKWE